jgi:hypothetical protein
MKKFLSAIVITTLFIACSNIETTQEAQAATSIHSYNPEIQRSGCCSHHGGACECSGHHVICCDGWSGSSCSC